MFRPLRFTLFLPILPALAGCMHFTHKDPEASAHAWRVSDQVPDENKSCVFVFLIDPLDPFASGSLTGVRDYIQDLGFGKTYYGNPCHVSYFVEKMHWIRGKCGTARFVVVGFDAGAEAARQLVEAAAMNEVPIELAIYLEPKSVDGWEAEGDVPNRLTIRAADLVDPRAAEGGNAKYDAVTKSDVPTHPQVLSLIERELSLIAMSVPPPKRPDAPRVLLAPQIPPPRNTPANPRPLTPEWQFLRPREPWEMPPPKGFGPSETLPLPKPIQGPPIPKSKN